MCGVNSLSVLKMSTTFVLRMSGQFSLKVIPSRRMRASFTITPFRFMCLMTWFAT